LAVETELRGAGVEPADAAAFQAAASSDVPP